MIDAVKYATENFNPRSPRGERLLPEVKAGSVRFYFNPRSPRGERLRIKNMFLNLLVISIHALREESDGNG